MSGKIIVRKLLIEHAPLTAIVPVARIVAGMLPKGTKLPAISITSISAVDRNILSPGARRHVVERVQVTVLADNETAIKTLMPIQKRACADMFPTVAGLVGVTVHTDGGGPDFMDEQASIYMKSQDFRVAYSELR